MARSSAWGIAWLLAAGSLLSPDGRAVGESAGGVARAARDERRHEDLVDVARRFDEATWTSAPAAVTDAPGDGPASALPTATLGVDEPDGSFAYVGGGSTVLRRRERAAPVHPACPVM